MDIIFLDVDGVLNNQKTMLMLDETNEILDDDCILRLKKILDNTNAKLVLSSTWRNRKDSSGVKLYEGFKRNGIDPKLLIGRTPHLYDRPKEINKWVEEHDVNKWIAIDDMPLKLPEEHFVKTDFIPGLSDENVEKAIELLK